MTSFALTLAAVAGLLLYWLTGLPGLVLAGGAMAAYSLARGPRWNWRGLPVTPAALYGVAMLCATLLSTDFGRSYPAACWQVMLGLLAMAVATLVKSDVEARSLLRAAAVASLVVMAPNVYEWARAGFPLLWRVMYDHNNGVALFNIVFIMALATGELKHKLWWPWLAAFVWITWFSGSRGATLGLIASLTTIAILMQTKLWLPAALTGVVPLCAFAAAGFDGGRLTSLSDRPEYWSVAWGMFNSHPTFGAGADTFLNFYNAAHPDRAIYNFNHAHSLYLNTLAEGGIFAFWFAGWLALEVARRLWLRRGSPWAAGALAMLAGLLAHSLVDVPTSSAYVATAAVLFVAVGLVV